jgi:2-polyprenyl-3-methyl-5-hydroxy-6-metoxy-1,4-benzoquinol methylase
VEEATNNAVKFMDLSSRKWLGHQFDWILSLEVGEHIPHQLEDVFIGNLVRHAKKGIILSWAVPGQEGHHHVNNR